MDVVDGRKVALPEVIFADDARDKLEAQLPQGRMCLRIGRDSHKPCARILTSMVAHLLRRYTLYYISLICNIL
jgi:hypothetical protein